jgi:hypothetical protein
MTRNIINGIALALALAAGATSALAQGTAFTYQGKLESAGEPVSSLADIQFSLFTADAGGSQVGSTQTLSNVTVTNGLFTTPVDFGVNPYTTGQNLFLQIAVRNPAGSGPFVPLTSRQRLTPAPFSLATRGLNVDAAGDIALLSGVDRRISLPGTPINANGTNLMILAGNANSVGLAADGGDLVLEAGKARNSDQSFVRPGDVIIRSGGNLIAASNAPNGGDIILQTGSTFSSSIERMRITPTGNVGIGTNAPTNKLDVRVDGYGITHRNVAGSTDLTTYVDNSEAGIGTVSSTPFSLYTNNTNRLTVLPNGNVGIGTGSPQAPLHVRAPQVTTAALLEVDTCGAPCGGQSYTEALRLINIGAAGGLPNGAGQVGLGMSAAAAATATSTADIWVGTGFPTDAGNGTNDFIIATKTGATALTNRVRINGDNGNFGIGTESPQARLHNVGTTRLDGEIQLGAQTLSGATGSNVTLQRFAGANSSNVVLEMGSAGVSAFLIQNNGVGRIYMDNTGAAAKPGGGAWAALSDERSKNDIQPLTGTLDRLLQLKGHAYTYKSEFVKDGRALPGTQIGLVAQEVEAIFPDWVSTGPDGLKQVTERSTTALMVEALRDLRAEKDSQIATKDAQIATLEERLAKIEALLAVQASQQK